MKYKIDYKLKLPNGELEEDNIEIVCKCSGVIEKNRRELKKKGVLLYFKIFKL